MKYWAGLYTVTVGYTSLRGNSFGCGDAWAVILHGFSMGVRCICVSMYDPPFLNFCLMET